MYEIIGFSSAPRQTLTFILDDGLSGVITLNWMHDYLTWFVDIEILNTGEKIKGVRLCNSKSLLENHRYKGFDLMCVFPEDKASVNQSSIGKNVKLYVIPEIDFVPVSEAEREDLRDYLEQLHLRN